MREILFRGKPYNPGLCYNHCPDGWKYGFFATKGGACFITEVGTYSSGKPYFSDSIVDPETVGQFTGLTDKNGKKIYEGDIVDCWSEGVNAKGTVQQRKDGLWIIYPAWQKTIMWGLCPDEYCHTTVEVIGNIHDNPELIEQPKDQ